LSRTLQQFAGSSWWFPTKITFID